MSERPSTPPLQAAASKPGVLPTGPLTPEQVKRIVRFSTWLCNPHLTYLPGNQPSKSQSPPHPTRVRNQQDHTPHHPHPLHQQPLRRPKTPLLSHNHRHHIHTPRCPKHRRRHGQSRQFPPPGRDPAGAKLYKVRRI